MFDDILGFAGDFGKSLSGVFGFAEKLAPLLSLGQLGFDVAIPAALVIWGAIGFWPWLGPTIRRMRGKEAGKCAGH